MNLGNCPKCQSRLAVVQRNKYRLAGDQKVLLDEEGRELRQDSQGRLSGKPALEWLVACGDCGRECREHPHQRTLDEAAARRKVAETPAPAFLQNKYVEVNGFDAIDNRVNAVEASFALAAGRFDKMAAEMERRFAVLQATLAELREQQVALQETLAAAMAGERGRRKAGQT